MEKIYIIFVCIISVVAMLFGIIWSFRTKYHEYGEKLHKHHTKPSGWKLSRVTNHVQFNNLRLWFIILELCNILFLASKGLDFILIGWNIITIIALGVGFILGFPLCVVLVKIKAKKNGLSFPDLKPLE